MAAMVILYCLYSAFDDDTSRILPGAQAMDGAVLGRDTTAEEDAILTQAALLGNTVKMEQARTALAKYAPHPGSLSHVPMGRVGRPADGRSRLAHGWCCAPGCMRGIPGCSARWTSMTS
jgi:hypothetical protein